MDVMTAEATVGSGIWSRRRDEITFDRLQKFWNDLPPQARQELLRLDKQTLIEQARKNFYCSRCNGLLLENFKCLQQEVSDIDCLSVNGESRIRPGKQDESQDPSVYPWGGLAAKKDGILTLTERFIKSKSLRALQNVFDNARAREREREMLYPDACGGGGRGWISQGMASYSRGYGTRETCALHTAHLSCNTLVNFWSALCEETRSSLLRMKEEDFIERLMYRFDSKRFCRDCRRNVIREFKELKELKRMRREPRCTSWFCVADTAFQCEVFEDSVIVDWRQYLSEIDGSYHHFEWAIGTDEGQSDVFGFENVGMNAQVYRNGIDLDQFEDYFITLRTWRIDGRCTELSVKAHALKGQSCVHHRLVVGDGFVTITKGETIRSLFEHAEEAEEDDEDDAMDRDGNDLEGDGSHPQKHAKSPELAREFLLDAAAVIFKEQVEKAFREGAAQQNAQSVFVSLALKLLEERVHVACKEIITLEKQNKLLEEEEKEKREEQERRMRRRTKEREKKNRRKERLKEKERDKGKKLDEFKSAAAIPSSALSNSSTCTNDESSCTFGSRGSASEEEDSPTVADLRHLNTCIDRSPCKENNGHNNVLCCNMVTKIPPTNSSEPSTSEKSKSSRRNLRLRMDFPQDQSSCRYDDGRDESISGDNFQWQSRERTRNDVRSGNSVFTANNRTRDRCDYSSCGCDHQEDHRTEGNCSSPTARSGREMKVARKTGVHESMVEYHRCYPWDSFIVSKGSCVGSTQEKNGISKQVQDRMDAQNKTCLEETNNVSGSVDNVNSPIPVKCDINGCRKLDTGCQGQASERSSERIKSACGDGTVMMNKKNCYSTNDEGSRHDEELMMNSAGSDGSSSCLSEGDRESSTSSITSLSAQNPESSSSDSEESSERAKKITEGPSTRTASRSLLETCAGNGFREYHPKITCLPHNDKSGFSVSPYQDQLFHHQNMHVPPYSPGTMGPHTHSCAAPTNGYFQFAPPNFFSRPLGFQVPGNRPANLPVQYNDVHSYAAPAFSCTHREPIHKTSASFRIIPPYAPYQHGTRQIGGHPHGNLNPDRHLPKSKPMGPKDAAENENNSQDGSAAFSLFQFNLPIAAPAPPSSNDGKRRELAARTPFAPVQAQPCSREQTDVKEYNLFSTGSGYFHLSR